MRPQLPILDLWRITLEAVSPLSISSGRSDLVDDVVLARTPAGLPYIPGTALAGVLRHALIETLQSLDGQSEEAAEAHVQELFGFVGFAPNVRDAESGHASRLECSHAHIHDADGCVVSDLLAQINEDDPILSPLVHRLPVKRQRVRMNAMGAAADGGHFDRTVVPAGHRFSVELRVWSATTDDSKQARDWVDGLLVSPALRVGALTRSGLGQLQALAGNRMAAHRTFDLRNAADLQAYLGLNRQLQVDPCLLAWTPKSSSRSTWHTLPLKMTAEAGLRVGQGDRALSAQGQRGKPADDMPYVEDRVIWPDKAKARMEPRVVIPATAVKGALAHRLAFHDRRQRSAWATASTVREAMAEHPMKTKGQAQWMGDIKRAEPSAGATHAGLLAVDDIVLPLPGPTEVGHRTHNSLDRFTGGVRDGILFTEEYLFRPRLNTHLHLHRRLAGVDTQAWAALRLTLEDLMNGRLALGADSSGGLGYVNGSETDHLLSQLDALNSKAGAVA